MKMYDFSKMTDEELNTFFEECKKEKEVRFEKEKKSAEKEAEDLILKVFKLIDEYDIYVRVYVDYDDHLMTNEVHID